MSAPLRIANCSGFYGDRLAAAREMVEGRPDRFSHRRLSGRADDDDPLEGAAEGSVERLRRHVPQADGGRAGRCARPRRQDRHQRRRPQSGRAGRRAARAVRSAGPEGEDPAHRRRRPAAATRRRCSSRARAAASRYRPAAARAAAPSRSAPMPISARGASSKRSIRGRRSWSARASPTLRSSSARRPGTLAGSATIGIAWPEPSSPGTWSNAARSAPAATTPSSRGARARASRLSDRRNARRRFERDHQAPGHRRAGLGRHGHGPVAVRNRQAGLHQSRRRGALRHDPARARGPRSRADLRRARRAGAADGQGLHELSGRLPQPDDVRADRARTSTRRPRWSSGRCDSALRRRAIRLVRRRPGPHRQAGRRDESGGLGAC